jgi:hypothetical protein
MGPSYLLLHVPTALCSQLRRRLLHDMQVSQVRTEYVTPAQSLCCPFQLYTELGRVLEPIAQFSRKTAALLSKSGRALSQSRCGYFFRFVLAKCTCVFGWAFILTSSLSI